MKRTTMKRVFAMLLTLVLTAGELCMGAVNVYAADGSDIKGWAIKKGGVLKFKDKALFRPSWLMRLTYDDSVTLYAVWE